MCRPRFRKFDLNRIELRLSFFCCGCGNFCSFTGFLPSSRRTVFFCVPWQRKVASFPFGWHRKTFPIKRPVRLLRRSVLDRTRAKVQNPRFLFLFAYRVFLLLFFFCCPVPLISFLLPSGTQSWQFAEKVQCRSLMAALDVRTQKWVALSLSLCRWFTFLFLKRGRGSVVSWRRREREKN